MDGSIVCWEDEGTIKVEDDCDVLEAQQEQEDCLREWYPNIEDTQMAKGVHPFLMYQPVREDGSVVCRGLAGYWISFSP